MHKRNIIALTIGILAVAGHSQEPEKLASLRSSWQRARDQAIQPVDVKYRVALEQMMDSFTKAGDLNSALAVRTELEKLNGTPQNSSVSAPTEQDPKKIKYRYEFIEAPIIYAAAVERAKAAGGHIAFPKSEREIKEFREMADEMKVKEIFLGVRREPFPDSKWICADGSELDKDLLSRTTNLDQSTYTILRLGLGSALSAHHHMAPLPFIIAIPE